MAAPTLPTVAASVPIPTTPLVINGVMARPWYQFFVALWQRTGGGSGAVPVSQGGNFSIADIMGDSGSSGTSGGGGGAASGDLSGIYPGPITVVGVEGAAIPVSTPLLGTNSSGQLVAATLTVGGDLSGTLPDPEVVGVNGAPIPLSTAVVGTDASGHIVSGTAVSGDLSGNLPAPTVVKVNAGAIPVSEPFVGTNSLGQIIASTLTVGGDLSGSLPNPTVVGIEGGAIPTSVAVIGTNSSGQIVSGTAVSGDLSGNLPSPTVVKVNGASIPLSVDVVGTNASGQFVSGGTVGGDLSGSLPNPTVVKVNGAGVPASATLLASNSSDQIVAASLTMGGDLSGSYPNPTVDKVNGGAIPASATLLASNGSDQIVAASLTMGGDLTGSYPNPVVHQVNGGAVPLSAAVVGTNGSGQLVVGSSGGGTLTVTDGTHSVASATTLTVSNSTVGGTSPNATLNINPTLTGDVTGIITSAVSVVKVNGGAVPVSAAVVGTNSSGQLIVGSSGGGTLTVSDGTHSVASATSLTFTGATVGGTSPAATVNINTTVGGDLSGTLPNPTVVKVNGGAIPASATLLASNGSDQIVAASLTMGGDLSGSYPNPTVAKVNGLAVPVSEPFVGTNSSGQFIASTIVTSGDVSGNLPGPLTVTGVNGVGVPASELFLATDASGHLIGATLAMGGDLSGLLPNPIVSGVEGAAIPLSAALLGTNSSRQLIAASTTMGGDLSGSFPNPVVHQVNGGAVPISAALVGTNSSGQLVVGTAAFQLIATIAALRANTTALVQIYVQGYYADGDGGEGPFWYNSADTTSADNGGTIIVDASSRRWYRDTGGDPYSVRWFGAKGNGTTDDATSINNAILARSAASGGQVYFPQGTYAVGSTIVLRTLVTLVGAGRSVTIIQGLSGTTMDVMQTLNFSSLTGTNSAAGPYRWGLFNLSVNGNSRSGGRCIAIVGYNYIFHDVEFYGAHGDGMYSEWGTSGLVPVSAGGESMESHITRTTFYSNGGNGLTFNGPHDTIFTDILTFLNTGSGAVYGQTANYIGASVIMGMHSYGNQQVGIQTSTSLYVTQLQSENNRATGGVLVASGGQLNGTNIIVFENTGYGISLVGNSSTLSSVFSYDNSGDNIVISGVNNVLTSISTTASTGGNGINIVSGATGTTINSVVAASNHFAGVAVAANDVRITDAFIEFNQQSGIAFSAGVSTAIVSGEVNNNTGTQVVLGTLGQGCILDFAIFTVSPQVAWSGNAAQGNHIRLVATGFDTRATAVIAGPASVFGNVSAGNGAAGGGYICKSGLTGAFDSNVFNIHWTGSAANLWIDGASEGNFITSTTTASGDLTGAYPAPVVHQVNGAAVPVSAAVLASNSSGQLIVSTAGLQLIATIAALRANTTALTQIYVQGYYADGDGGEGPFWYNAADTSSADNHGTIIVDASGRRWYRDTGALPLSIRWFGAHGNGSTDDTAAIQATVNVGAAWYVPPGTYPFTSVTIPLITNFDFGGCGQAGVLKQTGTGFKFTSIATGIHGALATIHDLTFDGTAGTGHTFNGTYYQEIDYINLYFNNVPPGNAALFLAGNPNDGTYMHDVRVRGLRIYCGAGSGNAGLHLGATASDTVISDFIMQAAFTCSYCVYADTGAATTQFQNIHIYNAAINNVGYNNGGGNLFSWTNCRFDYALGQSFATNNSFDNIFSNCYFEAITAGNNAVVLQNSSGFTFLNCQFTVLVNSTGYANGCITEVGTCNYNKVVGGAIDNIAYYVQPFGLTAATDQVTSVAWFLTQNRGLASWTGTSTTTVVHGLGYPPTAGEIQLTPFSSLGATANQYWVSSITATFFIISVLNTPGGATFQVAWSAKCLGAA